MCAVKRVRQQTPIEMSTALQAGIPVSPRFFYLVLACQHFSFYECWLCSPLFHIFKFFFSQGPPWQCLDGHNPTTNLHVDQAAGAVSPKFEPNYWVLVIYFIECWSCAPLSHIFKRPVFFLRYLNSNKLSGSIPAQISALVELNTLWALTSFGN